jgi:hypothetical protein
LQRWNFAKARKSPTKGVKNCQVFLPKAPTANYYHDEPELGRVARRHRGRSTAGGAEKPSIEHRLLLPPLRPLQLQHQQFNIIAMRRELAICAVETVAGESCGGYSDRRGHDQKPHKV